MKVKTLNTWAQNWTGSDCSCATNCLTFANRPEQAVGGEVACTEPGWELTELHIHEPLLSQGHWRQTLCVQ